MSARGQLEQIQGIDIGGLDSGDISETPDDIRVWCVMNDERTTSLAVSSIPHFPSTSAEFLGRTDLVDVMVSVDASEQSDSILRLGKRSEVRIFNDERNFEDRRDSVAAGHDKRWDGGGSDGRNSGISLLIEIDFDVPFAPGLGGGKTTATTTHVAKRSLAGTMGSSAANTGDTSDSSSCAPGFGRGLE